MNRQDLNELGAEMLEPSVVPRNSEEYQIEL